MKFHPSFKEEKAEMHHGLIFIKEKSSHDKDGIFKGPKQQINEF